MAGGADDPISRIALGLPALAPAGMAVAQTPAPAPETPAPVAIDPDCCRVVAGTVIDLEIAEPITSWQHKRGDKFQLRLAQPLVVDGRLLVPAGTTGVGEIVHAAAARGGGAPGELLIAARHLDVDGGQLLLRGMKLGGSGGDNSGMAFGVSFAAGPFAMFIRGHEIEIPAGARAYAKVAEDAVLPVSPALPNPTTRSNPCLQSYDSPCY
jgi:hypothetical protein